MLVISDVSKDTSDLIQGEAVQVVSTDTLTLTEGKRMRRCHYSEPKNNKHYNRNVL